MEFDIVVVTELVVGLGAVWPFAMGAIYFHLKHDKKRHQARSRAIDFS